MEFEAFHSSGQMFNAVLNFFPMKDVNGECRFMVAVLLTPVGPIRSIFFMAAAFFNLPWTCASECMP